MNPSRTRARRLSLSRRRRLLEAPPRSSSLRCSRHLLLHAADFTPPRPPSSTLLYAALFTPPPLCSYAGNEVSPWRHFLAASQPPSPRLLRSPTAVTVPVVESSVCSRRLLYTGSLRKATPNTLITPSNNLHPPSESLRTPSEILLTPSKILGILQNSTYSLQNSAYHTYVQVGLPLYLAEQAKKSKLSGGKSKPRQTSVR